MYVITVIPIQRGIGKEVLTYFTSSKVELGSLVEVPLRKKTIDALVIEIEDVRARKSEIKSATFTLRKMDKMVSKPFLNEAFMETVNRTAKYHAATTGAVLNALLPKKIIQKMLKGETLEDRNAKTKKPAKQKEKASHKEIRGTLKDRIAAYQEAIQKADGTAVIVAPAKERQQTLKKFFPITPILLPSSLFEIPLDTSLIIIEDEQYNSYKGISRPFLDFRFAIKTYAEIISAHILCGNPALGTETKKILVKRSKDDKKFIALGKTIEDEILPLKHTTGHLFVLGTRTGHSGVVLCQECGHTLLCKKCNAPLTLHVKKEYEEYNNLLCHHCGFKESALRACGNCGSWKLKSFGLGIEKVEEEIKAILKKHNIEANIARIDSTLKLTPKKIRDIIDTHYNAERSILLGTELVLPYLVDATLDGRKNTASCIPSLDSLLALPDFTINEKIWRFACLLDEVTSKRVIMQSKNPDNQLLLDWRSNDEKSFLDREHSERKTFNCPPYATFIKISVKGKKDRIGIEMKKIENMLSEWKPVVFPAFIKAVNNQHILHALLTIPKNSWPNEELLNTLLSLPLSTTINVNPVSLL